MSKDLNWTETRNVLPMSVVSDSVAATTVNVAMLLANTEYSYVLPQGTKKFLIKLRNPNVQMKLNLGKTPWQSAITYIAILENSCFYEESINTDVGTTLYFQSASANQVAEIIIWK